MALSRWKVSRVSAPRSASHSRRLHQSQPNTIPILNGLHTARTLSPPVLERNCSPCAPREVEDSNLTRSARTTIKTSRSADGHGHFLFGLVADEFHRCLRA